MKKIHPIKKIESLIKKDQTDVRRQIFDAGIRLRELERSYRMYIEINLRAVRFARSQKKENTKAQIKLKNAYYSLQIVRMARERLEDIETTRQLNETMNEMSEVLKLMNGIYGKTEKISRGLNRNLESMEQSVEKDHTLLENIFSKAPIDTLVDDTVIERLVQGESLESCLDAEAGIVVRPDAVRPFTDELFARNGGDQSVDPIKDYEQMKAQMDEDWTHKFEDDWRNNL